MVYASTNQKARLFSPLQLNFLMDSMDTYKSKHFPRFNQVSITVAMNFSPFVFPKHLQA